MPDAVDPEAHCRMMSGIRSENTELENLMWQALRRPSFRFSLHSLDVPGRPDHVLPWHRVAIHAHGRHWKSHECRLFEFLTTRLERWRARQ